MSEKVGSVYIEASIDTTGVIQAGKSIATTSDKIERDLQGIGTSADMASMQLNKTAQAVKGASSALGGMGRYAQGVGYQLQDIAVQAQSGTSAFTILGQQGSQIASMFGPGGAVFGAVLAISAAIGGTLVASIKKAESEVEKLPESVQKRIEAIGKKFEEVDFSNRADLARSELGKLNVEYDKTQETIDRLTMQLKDLDTFGPSSKFVTGGQQYTKVWSETNNQLKQTKMQMADLQLVIDGVNKTTVEGLAGKSLDDVENKIGKSKDAAEGLAAQIQAATLKLTDGELAARRFAAAQVLGLSAAEQLPPALDASIVKLYKLEQAQLLDNEAAVERLKQAKELEQTLERIQRGEAQAEDQFAKERAAEDKLKEEEKRKVTTEFASVQSGIQGDLETPAQAAERELTERLAVIQRYYGFESEENAKRTQEGIDAETAYQKRLTEIKKQEDENRENQNVQMAQSAADTFGILADIAKEGGKKSFDQWKIFASAQAAISAALAITNALTLPPPLNFIAAGAVGAATAIQIAKINSAQYSGGGRLYGGPVQAGGMYPVTEDGRPEILKQGNRQYLIPGTSGGEVISNRDMQQTGGGGGITITYSPTIYAQQTDFETIMAGQPEAVLNAVRAGLASEGRTL